MRSLLSTNGVPVMLVLTIIAFVLLLILTFKVPGAKKKSGKCIIYMLIGGLFLGLPGVRAAAINNPFFLYMVIMIWSLLSGFIHVFLSDRFLVWTKDAAFGWKLLYGLSVTLAGCVLLLTFMKVFDYDFLLIYNLSALLTFFIPVTLFSAIDQYTKIPQKIFMVQKSWIYNRFSDLQFKSDEMSHFFIIKYKLAVQTGGEWIESLPMRAPGSLKFGDYFNATLEVYKVTQGKYTIEVRDKSNNYLGWYFFIQDGTPGGKMIDPNKTFIELGFTNPVYFGNSSPEEIETITNQADLQGKSFTIICKREVEYKSQLMQ